jgi:hypothetical protein
VNPSPLGNNPGANTQVPAQATGKLPTFITDSIYNSETPKSEAQDVTTTIRKEDCSGDQIYNERKMTNAEQLAHRCRPYEAGVTQRGDITPPDFQAGEIEYD